MSDNNEQEHNSELKIIGKIEVKIKPKNYEQFEERLAQVSYVHKILDKFIKDLNDEFVPKLDGVLDNNNKSINQLNNALAEEKSRLDELIVKVDENYEGLVKDLKQLQEDLENLRDEIPDIGEAPPRITGEENGLF
ncbi:MAG: hypothetical protein LBU02_04045 [Rickettsiales bacterium]|jgi:chromosome segregation ATPase|nr:hypothetical protein [Rickettsiales bacterium]